MARMRPVSPTTDDVTAELKDWLSENWDPDLTVGQWWERLGGAGWSAPSLPEHSYGRGLSREDSIRVQRTIAEFGALGAPGGLGLMLAAPTIATHGDEEQRRRYIGDIVTGRAAWCQLFSEPNAGSDLAGLQTRAEGDGDEFLVNGQKVWTSSGQVADLGMLLARTDPEVPKHQGISYFALDMHQPGIEVRPLREMTGRSLFNEVFITDARVPARSVIGGLNNGWAVANTTLAFERAGLGAGGGSEAGGIATAGTVAGDLDRRAGDLVRQGVNRRTGQGGLFLSSEKTLLELAKANGTVDDPTVRQDLVRLHILNQIAHYTTLRQKALRSSGADIPGVGNMAKLSMSQILRLSRDLGLRILGPYGTLHGYSPQARRDLQSVTHMPLATAVTEQALFAQGPSIYGGTDEIQHNILGERVLGLPREPGSNDRTTPFKDMAKNH